jgi:hypothetical protein
MDVAWKEVVSEPQPTIRVTAVFVEEPRSGGALLVGGGTNEFSGQEAWLFDRQRWTELCPQGSSVDMRQSSHLTLLSG